MVINHPEVQPPISIVVKIYVDVNYHTGTGVFLKIKFVNDKNLIVLVTAEMKINITHTV